MQLRYLGKENVAALLLDTLPPDWAEGEMVSWDPGANNKHPPKEWIKLVWRYLGEHFTTVEKIRSLGKLPLIPVNMSQTPITLTRLCNPSRVVVQHLNDVALDDSLTDVLTKLGLIVLNDLPAFISHHPAVLGTFVNPPSVNGVLNAMLVSSSQVAVGKFSEIVRKEVSTEGKHLLRSFLSNLQQVSPGTDLYNLLCSLPIFETLSKKFVSKQECLCAVPPEPLPIPLLQDPIDINQDDSKTLAVLLNVKILKPSELLCEIVFQDIERGSYSEQQIDQLMVYVLEHFAHVIHTDANFKKNLQMLSFIPNQRRRVRAVDLFDPRNGTLTKIFASEDVFPAGILYNKRGVLEMLEDLGMKTDSYITSKDLYQSAKLVSQLPHLPTAEQKSNAILHYLSDKPQKLQEPVNGQPLGALLRDMYWVSRLQERTPNFPPSSPWLGRDEKEARHFCKPTELVSRQFSDVIGTVKPVVDVEASTQIAKYFGWDKDPDVLDVVKHLERVICHYSKDEKPYYMVIVDQIYSFLSHADAAAVNRAFDSVEISDWVWNGDGFSAPNHLLCSKPPIDLTPYILTLPSEVVKYSHLFYPFGVREQSDASVLVQVLSMIKKKYDDVQFSHSEVKRDLQLSVNILNEVAREDLSPELQAKILLPVHVEGRLYVRLEPVEHCMYCEHEWVKIEGDDQEMEYFYVHPNVPNGTAERLGVPTLANRMLNPDELFIGEEFGQEEKLTTRLNRLLEDYTDGFAVLKELIQNADDAGATEVRFLYDERTNEDATTCLIDEGMRGCQGPALWVYNDAMFEDEDFVNITKLNEATKVHDTEKIGRFGLGFTAVYNLTDVPMFISRNYFAILDPHMSFLGKAVKNGKPGIKIDLNRDVKRLKAFTNQFKPFNGIFGCDLHLDKEHNSFDGTLFRFPLRTREQAIASDIKKLHYNDQEMRELLQMFLERAQTLLLFMQSVFCVGVYNLRGSSSQPSLMFQVTKSLSQGGILRELSVPVKLPVTTEKLDAEQQRFLRQCNFIQVSSLVASSAKSREVHPSEFPESSLTVDIDCSFTTSGLNFFEVDERFSRECSTWLVVSSMGNGQAMQLVKNDPSLLPSAGVAVQLLPTESNTYLPMPVVRNANGLSLDGTLFCYLPLPMHSGLPVHINGAFALTANRRHLQKQLEDDKTCSGVKWNCKLMQDSVLSAYLCLLEDVKSVAPDDGSYVFHSLWPKYNKVHQDCWPILTSFYTQLARGGHALFSDGCDWVDITQVVFLHPDLRQDPDIGDAAFTVLQNLAKEHAVVVDLPADVFQSFCTCGLWNVIEKRTYTKTRFFCSLFFPNLWNVRPDLRDVLVLRAMDDNIQEFDDMLRMHACIPASPSGTTLKSPGQLVHPIREASSLYSGEDGRFPCGTEDTFLHPRRLAKLEELGMATDDLPWTEVADRAESILQVKAVDFKAACKHVKVLLEFLENKMKLKDDGPSQTILSRLQEARFLPVLGKPKSFPLSWKGEGFHSGTTFLVAPKDLFLKEDKYLVCCTEPLVGPDMSKKVKELLQLGVKEVTTKHVMNQLEEAISCNIGQLCRDSFEEVSRICKQCYSFLQNNMANCRPSIIEWLRERRFILVGKQFLSANQLALEIQADCSPFLYKLPEDLSVGCSKIMKLAGVRERFEVQDYIACLQDISTQFHEMQLDERTLQVAVNMVVQLGDAMERSGVDSTFLQDKWGPVYLPDSRGVMRAVPDLCIKDCPWMPDDHGVQFVSEKIPWPTCVQLGVKTRREEALQDHDIGIPFGQQEKLTSRLKRILTGYPSDKELLKELLQNADDAQATEICFIKDPRHHPDEKVFQDSWKPLQGPALCVYNNRPFTKADIKGVQSLGEGSKGDDINKTGQYGVGFNAVYHLTDVPSFISKGEEIGDVLCVFDPHCKYVPNATPKEPGRMFKDLKKLKQKFPDVFPGYLEDHFAMDDATMFRFPLKSEKMAEESKISRTPVTVEKLDEMMEDLKKELFEVLLFVNNVKKISLCRMQHCGRLVHSYSVEIILSKEDNKQRKEFAHIMKKIGNQVQEEKDLFHPTSVEVNKCTYTVKLRDCFGKEEKWLIVQQVGFEKPVETSIVDAFKKQQLGMLPRGGVACLLESNNSEKHMQGKGKAYCSLPLPFETSLPVHINGQFALDHEARRNLWRDEASGYRSDWNNALLNDVIASCYLTLLDEVRGFIQLPVIQDSALSNLPYTKRTILERLNSYERLFPTYPIQDPHWRTLVTSVYQTMSERRMRLIPLLRSLEAGSSGHAKESQGDERVQVMWFPPTGSGKDRTYFNDLEVNGYFAPSPQRCDENDEKRKQREETRLESKRTFEETLLKTGFNLVAFSLTIFDSLSEAGVEVYCISPSAVMTFYKSFSDSHPLCDIGKIPCPVYKTPFKNEEVVCHVLLYCRCDEHFLKNLSELPLLLTQDEYLHAFSESDPRCLSQYNDILPGSPSIFVHSELQKHVFISGVFRKASVFRSLGVDVFAWHLNDTLPHVFLNENRYVKWCPDETDDTLPNPYWIRKVWNFLQAVVSVKTKKSEESKKSKSLIIRELLSPLSKWCLLPATVQVKRFQTSCCWETVSDHFLVPINMAESVIDFTDCGASNQKLVEVLRMLGVPELHSAVMINKSPKAHTSADSQNFLRHLVATLKTPSSLLVALKWKLQTDPFSFGGKLKSSDAEMVLNFFSCNLNTLTDADKDTLRMIPFFPKANGGLAKLGDSKGFIIPSEIPTDEMGVVEFRLNCLFLKSQERLADLYKSLQVEHLSRGDMYMKFILKCYRHISLKGKLAHLQYVRDYITSATGNEKEEKKEEKRNLLGYLKSFPFIPTKDSTVKLASSFCEPGNVVFSPTNNTLMTAASFYDPDNVVFSTMLSEDKFPPKPFSSEEWLPFLKKIGLVEDVSQDDFLRFASQVAHEAATAQTENTYKKSEVLVQHLISRHDVAHEGLLHRVRGIPFVAPHPVNEELLSICPPFHKQTDGQTPFIAFKGAVFSEHEQLVWTKTPLLPRWADPKNNLKEFKCSHGYVCHCLEAFRSQLQVVEMPSVDVVVSHCQTICSHVERRQREERRHLLPEECHVLTGIMERIYTFLQQEAIGNSNVKKVLESTRCILVERGRKFVLPSQAVLELYDSLEIWPFLYRVPPEFGKFQQALEFLGCSKSIKPTHYAMVLKRLHTKCQNAKLHPNEVSVCSKAVKGFFKSLHENPEDVSNLSQLYLPAVPPGCSSTSTNLNTIPVTLSQSRELMFNDIPAYGGRIQRLDQLFVLDLSLMGVSCKSAIVNCRDLMMKLPSALQPTMLSSVVKEKLSNPRSAVNGTNGVVNALRQQLSSVQFGRGMVRVVRDTNHHQTEFIEDVILDIERGLRSVELCAVEGLKTSLFLNNSLIPESEEDVQSFQDKQEVSGEEVWRVFVSSATEIDDITLLVSKVIAEKYGEFLGKNAYVLPAMLRHPPEKIWSLLDRMGIREDDTYNPAETDIYPEPGSFIPIEDHHLLNDSFEEFQPGEYVGYQLDDPSLTLREGVPTYIYAKIVEEVTGEEAVLLMKAYRVNIGHGKEPVVVNVADLHKFQRLKELSSQQRECHRNRREVFDEISDLLKDARRLPEEKRRQIVKRLYLRWHPDKNIGDENFCTEAFQHIQKEIARLDGSYGNCFASWGARAKEHGSQREVYKESLSKQYGSWESSAEHTSWQNVPPSFCKKNSQPGEAARWFRQAEADLKSGASEVAFNSPSYEWACFKCHQVKLPLFA